MAILLLTIFNSSESPVCFYIYYDGYKLRGYVPLKGNAINRDTNTAFGNNEEADEKFIRKELGIGKNDEFPFNNCEANYNKEARIVTGKQIGRASCRERVSSPV